MRVDPLAKVSAICLAFPGAVREVKGAHAAFLVRGKTFAYFLNDHHGDGIVSIACKALPGDNARLVAASPERFYPPAYLAHRGWVALRLDTGAVSWDEVRELVSTSLLQIAPERVAGRAVSRARQKKSREKPLKPVPHSTGKT